MRVSVLTSVVIGSLVWIVVCIAGGFVVLARLGEYGSVVQLLIAAAMGLLGAFSHAVLSAFSGFRRLGVVKRGLLNWLVGYLPLVAMSALFVNVRIAESSPDFWPEMAKLLLLYIGTPMLFLALLVSLVTGTRAG